MPILLKFLQEIKEEKTLLNSFDKGNTTLFTKAKHTHQRERKLEANIPDEHKCKKKKKNQPTNQTNKQKPSVTYRKLNSTAY